MNQTEKRLFLIRSLLNEQPRYQGMEIPYIDAEQKRILRSLLNIRMPGEISDEFLNVQDEYLREETKQKGITNLANLSAVEPGLYLWKGDITTLACDAIVNAANSGILIFFSYNQAYRFICFERSFATPLKFIFYSVFS